MIICDQGEIRVNEYKDILYNGLFSLIDNLLEPPEDADTMQVTYKNTFLFMQDNAPCYKVKEILKFLVETYVPVI
jgi:hypothetical protein